MPNIAKVLKAEIQRISRNEIKAVVAGLRKDVIGLKKTVADLKKRLAKSESYNKSLLAGKESVAAKSAPDGSDVDKARITAKMIRSIRDRLGLSQNAFAKLVGVSSQAVYQWERTTGRLKFRGATKAKIIAVRKIGKREAKKLLITAGV